MRLGDNLKLSSLEYGLAGLDKSCSEYVKALDLLSSESILERVNVRGNVERTVPRG